MATESTFIQQGSVLEKLSAYESREKIYWRLATLGMYVGYLLDRVLAFEGGISMLFFIIISLLLILYLNEGNGMSFRHNLQKTHPQLHPEIFTLLSLTNRAHAAQLLVFIYIFVQGFSSGSSDVFMGILIVVLGIVADQWFVSLAKKRRKAITLLLTPATHQ